MTHPYADCPPCPKCGAGAGTRAGGSEMAAYARRLGPSHLSCAACGHVWEASAEDVARAAKADAAWEVECQRVEAVERAQLGVRR